MTLTLPYHNRVQQSAALKSLELEKLNSPKRESSPRPFTIALVGDANSYTLQLSKALNSLTNVNCIFYGPEKKLSGPTKGSVRFQGFKIHKPIWTERLYPFQILKQSLRDRPDAIHVDFTITEFSSQYLNMVYFPALIILLKTLRFKVALTIHDVLSRPILEELFGNGSLRAKLIHSALLGYFKLLAFSDKFVVHLKILRDTLTKEFLVDPKRIILIPFGVGEPRRVDTFEDYWKERLGGRQVVLALGVVAPRKGLEFLIDGFAKIAPKHPNSILVLAGPRDTHRPDYLDNIIRMANSSLPPEQFLYAGYLDESKASALIDESRVVALSYLYACATTSILYWIMSHRKPVIASAIGTLQEELDGYDESMFVGPKNPVEISNALDRALDDEVLLSRARKFMDYKASAHSWERIAPDLMSVYESRQKLTPDPLSETVPNQFASMKDQTA